MFFFFLYIDLYFLIALNIAQIFNHIEELVIPTGILKNSYWNIEELVIPTGIPTKEAEAEIEIHPLIVEPKLRKHSI